MQTVILCGGLGSRLGRETQLKPKPLLKIGNLPILCHIMNWYGKFGFNDFILCLGYRGEDIKEFFVRYKYYTSNYTLDMSKGDSIWFYNRSSPHWKITFVDTGLNTDTGSRIRQVASFLEKDEDFMLTYGDGLGTINIKNLLEFHRMKGKLGTVTGVNPVSKFGKLKIRNKLVEVFNEKKQMPHDLINGGFFVFKKKFLDYIPKEGNHSLEAEPLEKLVADRELAVFIHRGFWQCMDTNKEFSYLNKLWEMGEAPWI